MTETIIDICRGLNVALFAFASLALLIRGSDDWPHLSTGLKVTVAGQVSVLAALAYGSAEALIQDAPAGARTILLTIGCIAILAGLWVSRREAPNRSNVARVRDRAAEVAAVLEHAEHLEPCPDPDCIWMRERMNAALRP